MNDQIAYYTEQYDAVAAIPDHPRILTRWLRDSAHVRRTKPALLDLAYGESAAERLDFFPANRSGAPLLIFIHGGWWRSRDKSNFSFMVPAYTQAGFNVALTNYGLAPAVSMEDITRQQLHAIAWLYQRAEDYDFDPQRIVVAGHSAGAHLAAMMMSALWPVFDPALPSNLVKAGVLLSGLYDLTPIMHADFVNADLKLTPQRSELLSPAFMPQAHPAPFISAVGALESDEFKRQNALIGQVWNDSHAGDIAVPDKNHITICDAFATPGEPLFEATVKLINGLKSDSN